MRFLMLNWRDPANPLAGGAERVTLAFMKGLVDRGHEVDWFTFAFPGCRPEDRLDGIRITRSGGVFTSVLAARRWYRGRGRYDLVIDQHHGIPWYAPWWCGTRCLAYIHEVLGPIWSSFYPWPRNRLGQWQERWTHWLYRNVPFWVPSESTRRALSRHGVRKVKVLPNGVDVRPLDRLPCKPCRPDEILRLVAVSRLAPNKRVDHAIRTLLELRKRGRQAELTVIGSGIEADRLKAMSRELGVGERVRFSGHQSEEAKFRALAESHVLIHPSVREGWGLNVIEANAMGTPAAVYPVDGLVDSTVDRVTGVVAEREVPEALAEAVLWMANEDGRYQALREAAWKRSREFSWEAVLPPAAQFLESLASGQKMV